MMMNQSTVASEAPGDTIDTSLADASFDSSLGTDGVNTESTEATNFTPACSPSNTSELFDLVATQMDWTGEEDLWPLKQDSCPSASKADHNADIPSYTHPLDMTTGTQQGMQQHYTSAMLGVGTNIMTDDIDTSEARSEVLDLEHPRLSTHDNSSKTDTENIGMDRVPAEHSMRDDDGIDMENEFEQRKWEFRPQRRAFEPSFTTTWIDHDTTGDFDPAQEARRERETRKRAKARQRAQAISDGDGSDANPTKNEPSAKARLSLVVTLKVSGEGGIAALRQIPNRAPSEWDDFFEGYRLRSRPGAHSGSTHGNDDYCGADGIAPDHNGHSAARGCWECLSLGQECSLLGDERRWPCYTCDADGNDCVLVTEPRRKQPCKGCNSKRTVCSYGSTINHSLPCLQCREKDARCVAGPALDAIRPRIRYDRDWNVDPAPHLETQTVVLCKQCRQAGRACSLTNGDTDCLNGPKLCCTACEMAGESCHSEVVEIVRYLTEEAAASELRKKRRKVPTRKPSTDVVLPPEPATESSGGLTRTIRTKLCHPIEFNWEGAAPGGKPCHFCSSGICSILGLAEREVEVIDWADGRGLDEISGGHRAEEVENTKVCVLCTTQRTQIILCENHELRPVPGVQRESLNLDAALDNLLDSGAVADNDKWCSICVNLASYECHAGAKSAYGECCGLVLCEHCAVTLAGSYNGDLEKMLAEAKDEPSDERPLGLRADCELLKQDGLLMRYVLWSDSQ